MRRLAPALACLVLLAGCGADDPKPPPQTAEQQVREVWREAADAAVAGEGTAFCARVAPAGKERLTAQTQLPCEDTIRLLASRLTDADRLAVRGARITDVTITGNRALVRYATTPTLAKHGFTGRTELTKQGDQWLLLGI